MITQTWSVGSNESRHSKQPVKKQQWSVHRVKFSLLRKRTVTTATIGSYPCNESVKVVEWTTRGLWYRYFVQSLSRLRVVDIHASAWKFVNIPHILCRAHETKTTQRAIILVNELWTYGLTVLLAVFPRD